MSEVWVEAARFRVLYYGHMSKLRCFKCNQLGHASLNCKVKRTPDSKSNAPKGNGKNSQKGGLFW